MNVLAIGAHPADVFDLAAGTLANFAADGHDVYLALVTHGAYSHSQVFAAQASPYPLEEVVAVKKQECEQAAQHVGLKAVRYLELDDEPFIPSRQAILTLAEYVREVRPEIVITHHPREYGHPDHPIVGEVALRALKAAERWLQGSSRKPHLTRRVYFFGTQFRSLPARLGSRVTPPDFVVDITSSIERKKKALTAFGTQKFQGARYEQDWVAERVEKMEGHWGFVHGLGYAERFIALTPQIVRLLP